MKRTGLVDRAIENNNMKQYLNSSYLMIQPKKNPRDRDKKEF